MGLQKRLFHLLDLFCQTDEVCVCYWLPINADPVIDGNDMRGGKGRNFFAMPHKQVPHKSNGRSFPISPCYVDNRVRLLRIS